jgi:C4-dicarboxylate transporter DctM subunit
VSNILIAILMLLLMISMIFFGIQIAVSLLVCSVLGLWLITGQFSVAGSLLTTGPFYATFDYALAVIPLFVLMGLLSNSSGASADLYQLGFAWFGRLRGGLGIVTAIANAVFAAVTGVSIASAAVFSKIAVPEMLRYGYSKRFSTGCVAGTSALGMLIPPSIMLIVYGVLSDESIGKLFMAGIVPGIVLTACYCTAILVMAYLFPRILGKPIIPEKVSWGFRFRALAKSASIFSLVVLILGGIYNGIFTPTEAGAVGCMGALAIMFLKGRFKLSELHSTLMEAGFTTASVFLIVIGSQMFGRMLTVSGLIAELSKFVASLQIHPLLIITGMLIILMIMGAILDVVSILLISMPILLPVVKSLGFDLIWFGILSTVTIETGLVTPPFGMAVFVVKGSLGDAITIEDIYIGAFPFLLMLMVTIVLVLFFPGLATWLPGLM